MKTVLKTVLFLLFAVSLSAQAAPEEHISVALVVDGQQAACDNFEIELCLNGDTIKPKVTGQAFQIPAAFKKPAAEWNDSDKLDISLTCNNDKLVFLGQHPAFVRAGDWQLGMARPLYAVKEYGYTHEFDRGAWLGYLIFEGEPPVVTFVAQPDPLAGMLNALIKQQADASDGHARDIAYELAVLRFDYPTNRDHLLSVLNRCLLRPKESPENDECDGDLLKFVVNLYWRGDSALLLPLLRIADTRRDVIDDIGGFYADLLERRGKSALDAMQHLPEAQQALVCRLAYEDDFIHDPPKLLRVKKTLGEHDDPVAGRCLTALNGR